MDLRQDIWCYQYFTRRFELVISCLKSQKRSIFFHARKLLTFFIWFFQKLFQRRWKTVRQFNASPWYEQFCLFSNPDRKNAFNYLIFEIIIETMLVSPTGFIPVFLKKDKLSSSGCFFSRLMCAFWLTIFDVIFCIIL